MLNVFHISDLHYTATPSGQLRDAAAASVRSILELATALRANGTLGHEACLLITGDLVQSGEAAADGEQSDFEAVNEALIHPLLEILKIGPDRVFLVPGNHELDRTAVPEADWLIQGHYASQKVCEADIKRDLCEKLSAFFEFVERHGYRSVTKDQPRMASFECSDNRSCV